MSNQNSEINFETEEHFSESSEFLHTVLCTSHNPVRLGEQFVIVFGLKRSYTAQVIIWRR